MRAMRYIVSAVLFLILFQALIPAFGQLGISFDLKKPKEYEERVLRSERSDQKKFTLPRRFIQNTVTHYNYYFNANNKLNEVLERAKEVNKDDYSQLLPFYNYSLDVTAADSIQLDSITYKASTGIALHDLRNDWVDNLYLLWGASYYLQKKFDSAYLMFQFINYAFAPKEKDGYYRTIGSNMDGNQAYSISSREKNSLPRRIFSEPPSRNEAFIWQIRNFLVQDQFAEAASLIVTLRNDPNFPSRLKKDLHEVQAFWFYKQNMWDSSAINLVEALGNATNLQEKARWEFLAAQMFEMSGKYADAEKYYAKVSGHTTDPILDIYARLYSIRVNRDGDKSIEKNVAELMKMAKRDKYEDYRDIIYYMAAQMQLEGNNIDEAIKLLEKSTRYTSNDPSQRNKTFLKLAELSYSREKYRQAFNFYDSIKLEDPALKDVDGIKARKDMLGRLATNIEVLERQDSLQRIAAMPEDERKDFVKKIVKDIRKSQGLKDEPITAGPAIATPNLFPTAPTKGEWYFYNPSSKQRGLSEFKAKWGNRPNIDNWRRSSAISGNISSQTGTINPGNPNATQSGSGGGFTYDDLYANLPLTPEQLRKSNDSVQQSLFVLGKIYVQEIENCVSGTQTFEELRTKFPAFDKMDEVYFNLYYCYNKAGDPAKAEAIKKLMTEKFPNSELTSIVTTGKNPNSTSASEATKTYERIYDLFIEGQFEQALNEKKAADSKYGKNYWTPQLLYVESVYHIKQRNDSAAINTLGAIVTQFPNTPMAAKATNLINVLGRRAEIEQELRNMNVVRDTSGTYRPPVVIANQPPKPVDTLKTNPPVVVTQPPVTVPDTVKVNPPVTVNSSFTHNPAEAQYVVLLLNKVDPVFVNEAKNAFMRYNRDTYYNKTFTAELAEINPDNRILLLSPFKDAAEAIAYIDKAGPKTATEILPWLKGGKYSYLILSEANLNLLKQNKDIDLYKSFLNQYYPGKF